jgi:predicted aspartyl protease
MWNYNQEEQPPAPFLDVVVYHPEDTTHAVRIQAKIDTGADISAIPATLVAQLGLPIASKMVVEDYNGVSTTVSTYSVLIEVTQSRFRSREIISIPEAYVLLGRDVLNHFYIHLNGPELTFDLSETPI